MKNLLASTAAALLLAGPVYADGHASLTYEMNETSDFYASNLIGMRVYRSENQDTTGVFTNNENAEWDDIGEIDDLIVSQDGAVQAAIIGVGGFLGMGERDVAVSMSQIKVLRENDENGDRFLVVNIPLETLENAPEFMRETDERMASNETATDANTDTAAAPAYLTPPNKEMDGYQTVMITDLTAEDIQNTYVYGVNDETVGEVGKLIIDDSGKITKAVIDVGGFIGIGEKPVAVGFDELQILRQDNGDDVRIYIDSTQEALEKLPEYEG